MQLTRPLDTGLAHGCSRLVTQAPAVVALFGRRAAYAAHAASHDMDTDSRTTPLSRSRAGHQYLEQLPQWHDDVLMRSLFANLPNREAKPEAFAQKYTFWKDLLTNMTRQRLLGASVFTLASADLSSHFQRGGLHPICLSAVVAEMTANQLAADAAESLTNGPRSMLETLSSYVSASIRYGIAFVFPGEEEEEQPARMPANVLLLGLLREQRDMLLEHLADVAYDHGHNPRIPLSFREFVELVNASRRRDGLADMTDREDALLLLRHLKTEGVANFAPAVFSEGEACVIKIASRGDRVSTRTRDSVLAIAAIDFDIVKIKTLERRLTEQIAEMGQRVAQLQQQARMLVQEQGDRRMAAYHLKRKALLEKLQLERMQSLHTIETILLRITSVTSDAMILDAYKTGVASLQTLLRDNGLNVDHVADVVDDLQQLMTDHDEISAVLSQELASPALDSVDLEAELAALSAVTPVAKTATETENEKLAQLSQLAQLTDIVRDLDHLHVSDPEAELDGDMVAQ